MIGSFGTLECPKCEKETVYYIYYVRDDDMSILFHPLSILENMRIYFKHIPILEHREKKNEDGTLYYVVNCPECGKKMKHRYDASQ